MKNPDVTDLLREWTLGNVAAGEQLVPLIYDDLHRRAAACLRREYRDRSLQPTELVNEAFLRLVRQTRTTWKSRAQFFGVAAEIMRRILVDRARHGGTRKRSGTWRRITLTEDIGVASTREIEILDLDAALSRLATFDARKSRILELRFFAGLSLEETAEVLELSIATVERDWQAARAWLYAAMKGTATNDTRAMAPRH
jgi:RNA polymerase sigma factor (TIGR02999 family)